MIPEHFISIDWGTSRFRMALIQRADLSVVAQLETDDGIKTMHSQWKVSGEDRLSFYLAFIRRGVQPWLNKMGSNTPVIISGMASSSIGMKELAYAKLPFSCAGEGLEIEKLEDDILYLPTFLISGVRAELDVMRGEETILIGLHDQLGSHDKVLYILPGTHSKHVIVEQDKVVDFRTFMTGELFEVIRTQTILKDSTSEEDTFNFIEADFGGGVEASKEGNMLNELFHIRAADLLTGRSKEANSNFLSGLLVGEELRSLSFSEIDKIMLCGSDQLIQLYRVAAEILGHVPETRGSDQLRLAILRGHKKILTTFSI